MNITNNNLNDIPQTESKVIMNEDENDLLYKHQAQELRSPQPPGSTDGVLNDDVMYKHQLQEYRRQGPHHRSPDGNIKNNNLQLDDISKNQGMVAIQSDLPQTESKVIMNVDKNDLLYKHKAQELRSLQPPHSSSNENQAIQTDKMEPYDNHHTNLNASRKTNRFVHQNLNVIVERHGPPAVTNHGIPCWDTSNARKSLQKDIKDELHNTMTTEELWNFVWNTNSFL